MIKNEREYRITKSQFEKFQNSISKIDDSKNKDIHPDLITAQKDALRSQYEELKAELEYYEAIRDGKINVFETETIDDLPEILIVARIASGYSQKDLAQKIGVRQQQIQRYESSDYEKASLSRIKEIAHALDVSIKEEALLNSKKISISYIKKKLLRIGFDKEFIQKRFFENYLSQIDEEKESENMAFKLANYVSRVLQIPIANFLGDKPLTYGLRPLSLGRFKTPRGINKNKLLAYTIYAHKIALLTHIATERFELKKLPNSPSEFRSEVLKKYDRITFENILKFVWDLGIPVVPLNDPGAFHGATWRFEGKNILVLNQSHKFNARWLFDLLHEFRHALEEPENEEYEVIETTPIDPRHHDTPDEIEADEFAEDVVMDSRSEEIERKCIESANKNLKFLKSAVVEVAEKEGIEIDSLANHMAFRLSQQGQDWWGTATNLQKTDPLPQNLARDIYFEKIDLYQLNSLDRKILINALKD